jgi:hypothetical protein
LKESWLNHCFKTIIKLTARRYCRAHIYPSPNPHSIGVEGIKELFTKNVSKINVKNGISIENHEINMFEIQYFVRLFEGVANTLLRC